MVDVQAEVLTLEPLQQVQYALVVGELERSVEVRPSRSSPDRDVARDEVAGAEDLSVLVVENRVVVVGDAVGIGLPVPRVVKIEVGNLARTVRYDLVVVVHVRFDQVRQMALASFRPDHEVRLTLAEL